MTRVVSWSESAERELLGMPPSRAEEIVRAVEQFASTGRGFVRMLLDGAEERALYVENYLVFIHVSPSTVAVYRVRERRS